MSFRLTSIADLANNPLTLGAVSSLSDIYEQSFEEDELDQRDPGVHASEINKCIRQAVYTLRQVPKTDKPSKDMAKRFLIGHAVHEMVQSRFARILKKKYDGCEIRFEAEVKTNDTPEGLQRNITSSCDGVFTWINNAGEPFLRVGLEIKTESPDSWARLKKPKPEHVTQAHVYMRCLDVPLMWFFYYNKGNQESTPMRPPFLVEYDEVEWARLSTRIDTALAFKDHPARLLPDVEKGFHCSFCPYQRQCRSDEVQSSDDRVLLPPGHQL